MNRLFILNEGPTLRISPSLACEIGLNESIVLLQVDWLIQNQGTIKAGTRAIKLPLRKAQDCWLPFYSLATLSRIVENLVGAEYLWMHKEGNERWFALGPGCDRLASVKVAIPKELPKPEPKIEHETKPSQQTPMFNIAAALAEVCRMDLNMNRPQLLREAKLLQKEPAEIRRLYGPGGAWYTSDFRGKIGSPPTPAQVRQTWNKLATTQTASAVGKRVTLGGANG